MHVREVYENLPLPPGQVAGIAAGPVLARLRPLRLPGPRRLHHIAGTGLFLAGCLINAASLAERRRQESGVFELEHPRALVVTGPYAVSRHPMYVGWWLIHLGAGMVQGSAWALLTTPGAVLAEHPAVLKEERMLAELFGSDYAVYAQRVPRYLPLARRKA